MSDWVWVFMKDGLMTASAVFSGNEKAEVWIKNHQLTGVLTKMPIDIGGYEWCALNKEPMLEHYHYTKGIRES